MRCVESRLGILGRIGRDEREVERIGEIDQATFRRLLYRIAAPRHLDVETIGEQGLQSPRISAGLLGLAVGKQAGQSPLASRRQANQPLGSALQGVERDM